MNGLGSKVFLAIANPFPGSPLTFLAPDVAAPGKFEGEYIKGTKVDGNDEVILRYQLVDKLDLSADDPTNSSSPCTQALVLGPNDDPVNIYVVTLYLYVKNGSLMCRSRRDTINPLNPNVYDEVPPNPVIQTETSLIDNVQQMSATFGVDSIEEVDKISYATYYTNSASLNAAAVPSWVSVVSLRLSLVLKSKEPNVVTTITPYTIDGTQVTPTDHNLYRVFTTTIALRNQLGS